MRAAVVLCLVVLCTLGVASVSAACDNCQQSILAQLCQGKLSCCGNGVIEADEQCDDGNFVSGDGCTNCKFDGLVDRPAIMIPQSDSMRCSSGLGTTSTKIAYDGASSLYLLMTCQLPVSNVVAMSVSRDGGVTWSVPSTTPFFQLVGPVPETFAFQGAASIAANGPYVIIAWQTENSVVRYIRSTDSGSTWSGVVTLPTVGTRVWGLNVIFNGANVYIGFTNHLFHSSNSGASFVSRPLPALNSIFKDLRYEANSGRLYWIQESFGTSYSLNHGISWSPVASASFGSSYSEGVAGKDFLYITGLTSDNNIARIAQTNPTFATRILRPGFLGPNAFPTQAVLDVDSQGNLYYMATRQDQQTVLSYWPYNTGAANVPLDPVPGATSTLVVSGRSAFPALLALKGSTPGYVIAYTTMTSSGAYNNPSTFTGVWVRIEVYA